MEPMAEVGDEAGKIQAEIEDQVPRVEVVAKESAVGRFIEKGREIVGFFKENITKDGEMSYVLERLREDWRKDIPLTDDGVMEAVFNGRKDDVLRDGALPGEMYVEIGGVDQDRADFRIYSKNERGQIVVSGVSIGVGRKEDFIEVHRGRTQSEDFDAWTSSPKHRLVLENSGGYRSGEAVFTTEEQIHTGNRYEMAIQTLVRKAMVLPLRE